MSWVVTDADGAIVAILTNDPGDALEREVPPGYPETHDWDVASAEFVPSLAKALARLRAERDRRLRECDWTQLPDVPEPTSTAWKPYRQALRDMPETTTDPFNPVWPMTPPSIA